MDVFIGLTFSHDLDFAGSVKLQTGRITKLLAVHQGKIKGKKQLRRPNMFPSFSQLL